MTQDLTRRLKEFAEQQGAAMIGIAPAERLARAPEGKRPIDRLADAACVVSMAVQVPYTVCETWEVVSHNPYRVYGHQFLNRLLHDLAYKVTVFIESEGYRALPFPPTISGIGGDEISHRHVAVAAGIGEFGWAGYVLTPRFGARQRFVSIITEAPLETDPVYQGPQLCLPDKCGYKCVEACPMAALPQTKSKSCTIGGRDFTYTFIDKPRCSWAMAGLTKAVGGWKDIELPDVLDQDAYNKALGEKDPMQIRTEISQGGHATYCGKCQTVCPVGSPLSG